MLNTLPPDFWRLWSVGLIASVVRWVEMVAVGVVVYDQTGTALTVALITMLRMLPMGLIGAFVGTLADRFDRRVSLAAVVGLMAATSAVLAVVAHLGALEVWHLAVASLVNGLGWATDIPLRRIDHVLVSAQVAVHRVEALPHCVSDHLPLAVDIGIAAPSSTLQ